MLALHWITWQKLKICPFEYYDPFGIVNCNWKGGFKYSKSKISAFYVSFITRFWFMWDTYVYTYTYVILKLEVKRITFICYFVIFVIFEKVKFDEWVNVWKTLLQSINFVSICDIRFYFLYFSVISSSACVSLHMERCDM